MALRMDPLMKKRLHYFDTTDRDAAWFTDPERSREIRAILFEKLLMEEILATDTIRDSRFWALRRYYGTVK